MKKLFTKLGIVLIASTTIMPLVACSFNFYINSATNAISKNFANQTSALIKAMVMSKALGSDTKSTTDDIMNLTKNSSIKNLKSWTKLDNWDQLANKWGVNGKIEVNGFNPDEYFMASGKGSLTTTINSKNKINDNLTIVNQIRLLTTISNSSLSNMLFADDETISKIIKFLKSLQGDLEKSPVELQLVANLIKEYKTNFIDPLTSLMDNLVDGKWSDNQKSTPKNNTKLTTFFSNWKDPDNQPYSAWSNGTTWEVAPTMFKGHEQKDWNASKDYDLYRSGVLINYLFWKISKDQEEKFIKDGKTIRYLGDIISDHISFNWGRLSFDDKAFLADINYYKPFLLTNPLYILIIIQALVPVIKKWVLEAPDITLGIKNLTIGHGFPTKKDRSSYNLLDILTTIKKLINNPTQLNTILELLLGNSGAKQSFDTFAYDIKITKTIKVYWEVTATTTLGGVINAKLIDPSILIKTIIEQITSNKVKNIINSVISIITSINDQYSTNNGIDINLTELQTFLLGDQTDKQKGLLQILLNTIVNLKKLIESTKDPEIEDIRALYQKISDSCFPILKTAMTTKNNPFYNLLNLVIGPNNNSKLGITGVIINNNKQWIDDNYHVYYNDKIKGNKKPITSISNITFNKTTVKNFQTINLTYNFTYKIEGITYHFVVHLIDEENLTTFTGTRAFKFKSITLLKID